ALLGLGERQRELAHRLARDHGPRFDHPRPLACDRHARDSGFPGRGMQSLSPDLPPEVRAAAADPTRRFGGKYVLLTQLGRGGMGVVWRAYDVSLRRNVAIKMILDVEAAGAQLVRRFQLEAQATARLSHPHIVRVYEVGEQDGKPFIVMELVDGESLEAHL